MIKMQLHPTLGSTNGASVFSLVDGDLSAFLPLNAAVHLQRIPCHPTDGPLFKLTCPPLRMLVREVGAPTAQVREFERV